MAVEQREKSKIKSDILLRVRLLYLLFFGVGLLILGRLVWVQYFSDEVAGNSERIEGRIFRDEVLSARRGSILARGGEALASSIFRYRVDFDMAAEGFDSLELFHEQCDSLAKLLAAFFGDRTAEEYSRLMREEHDKRYRLVYRKDTTYYTSDSWLGRLIDRLHGEEMTTRALYDTLRDTRPVQILPREVDFTEWQTLKEYPILNWNLGMVYRLEPLDKRIYPQGELARRTIGRCDERGAYGVEAIWRERLAGTPGLERRQRIARGFSSRVAGYAGNVEPEGGADVVTTLDIDLQDVVDRALRHQLREQRALWGTSIVMECATGEILALSNLGRTAEGGYAELENYALSRRMEPGSTFKLAALLALLEDCGAELDLTYDSGNGARVMVGKAQVQDAHKGYGVTDLKTATAQSLNVFYARAIYEAYKENPQRYVDFLKHLHLDRPVGLEEYGERAPLLPEPGSNLWYPHVTLPNLGYGYAIELTPIQILTLYNAVANGGRMVAPSLVREIRHEGEVVERFEPRVLVEQIASEQTLARVRECLEEVALSGTAKYYFGDTTRYRVGAKTGTAKVAQGGVRYEDGYYLGSMVCYLPAEAPRYTILTSVYTRRGLGSTIYGAGLAGPVVRSVADYLAVRDPQPFRVEQENLPLEGRLKGGDAAAVRRVARSRDWSVEQEQRRGWCRVEFDSSGLRVQPLEEDLDRVPNVCGMGLKDALYLLESRGLRVNFSGRGAVVSQSLGAGEPFKRGATITIVLK